LLFLGLHQTKIFAAINDFVKTDEEWRKILSPEQFRILRKERNRTCVYESFE
jgi:hypothetical protein